MATQTADIAKDGTLGQKRPVERHNRPVRISHGTLECVSLAASRPFYEEFLGLEVVRHGPISMLLRKGGYWSIVCLQVGRPDRIKPVGVRNHWGIDLESREAVEAAHAKAIAMKDKYGIKKVAKITDNHGTYAFYFQDRDGNWWEFQHVDEGRYDKFFARGDIVEM